MTLYRRKPRNWLEKVWFRFRPEYVYAFHNLNLLPGQIDTIYYLKKDCKQCENTESSWESSKWFEANYEPVNRPLVAKAIHPKYYQCAEQQDPNSWNVKDHNADAGKMVVHFPSGYDKGIADHSCYIKTSESPE